MSDPDSVLLQEAWDRGDESPPRRQDGCTCHLFDMSRIVSKHHGHCALGGWAPTWCPFCGGPFRRGDEHGCTWEKVCGARKTTRPFSGSVGWEDRANRCGGPQTWPDGKCGLHSNEPEAVAARQLRKAKADAKRAETKTAKLARAERIAARGLITMPVQPFELEDWTLSQIKTLRLVSAALSRLHAA